MVEICEMCFYLHRVCHPTERQTLTYSEKEEPKHTGVRAEVQIESDCQINEDLFLLAPHFLKEWIDPEIKI